ncbi:MAG: cation-translocating P-type ATPase, partial [candidate division NC10 bacterium]|nr:cation-translocating P-type ATPase [candidate division NC10 bacterium]
MAIGPDPRTRGARFGRGRVVASPQTLEVPVRGMDCAECTQHVRQAIAALPGVEAVTVLLSAEKAVVRLDPSRVDLGAIRRAVEDAGYAVPTAAAARPGPVPLRPFSRRVLGLLGLLFGAVLFVVVAGERLGLIEEATRRVPWPVGGALVLAGGYPLFRKVVRAALRGRVIAHTLMTVGAVAALAVGEWATAAVVVFFMHVGDAVEAFTAGRARRAVRDLGALAPQMARVERDGAEHEVPVGEVRVGEIVVVRPGEAIPVDGEVVGGNAAVDQATITGEAMPAEVGPGARVFAATLARLGALRVRAAQVGPETTFGRVVRMVQEAEANRGQVQRLADNFSGYYLPVVAAASLLTFLLRRDPLASAAVLIVACSCSFALATPIAMLAAIGAAARRGLLIKGGRPLEALARADVLLVDKTGTLTLGRPRITDVLPVEGISEEELLALAACAERYSEHPLAEAVRLAARERGLALREPEAFEAVPGLGVRARVGGRAVVAGNRRMLPDASPLPEVAALEAQGKTLLFIGRDGGLVGLLAAADTLRPEVPAALEAVRALGVRRIELLTGDNERTAAALGERLGVRYRANLLPEDKIAAVKEYQREGRVVAMVGDGVNDAPALAQADVGIAMGAAGSNVAMEAGHMALLMEDWTGVPALFRIARRTMKVVKGNLLFTGAYNLAGLSLAALGFLPPVLAA